MALRLNLYHEIIKQKALKRRDPLKLSMYGLAAVIACFAAYYVIEVVKLHTLKNELAMVKTQFDKLEPQAKAAKKREQELDTQTKAGSLIVKRVENRFYWAPILEQIMQIVPRDVQVTRLQGDISGTDLRRCALSIDGLSAGPDPRKVAEELRTALADKLSPKFKNVSSKFRSLEDGTELVALDGKQMPTATFGINVELYTGEEKAPEPAHKKK